ALCGGVAIALVRRSRTREVEASQRAALLAGAGELLDRADAGRRLEELAGMAVGDLADLCVIDLVHDDGQLHLEAVAALDPGRPGCARSAARSPRRCSSRPPTARSSTPTPRPRGWSTPPMSTS